jgi:prophage antirepressor-like protein
MNNIIIKGVECRLNENGVIELNLEHVARGLGFTQIAKSGNEVVRWETVRSYLQEYNVIPESWDGVGKNGLPCFILENIFYKLVLKAKNETARGFQDLVTDEILPSIRKTGMYATPDTVERILQDPDTAIKILEAIKDERAKRLEAESKIYQQEEIIDHKNNEIKQLLPDAQYTRDTLKSVSTFTATQIAKELGMSAVTLNRKLHDMGVQYKVGEQWVLYAKYQDGGYVDTYTYTEIIDGISKTYHSTVWTEKGRKFIHELIKNGKVA